jgi:hypothetical protein
MAFNSRVRTYQAWQAADADVRRVKQTHEKNRAQGRIPPERLGYSLSQIAEVRVYTNHLRIRLSIMLRLTRPSDDLWRLSTSSSMYQS